MPEATMPKRFFFCDYWRTWNRRVSMRLGEDRETVFGDITLTGSEVTGRVREHCTYSDPRDVFADHLPGDVVNEIFRRHGAGFAMKLIYGDPGRRRQDA